ncbi:MAG: iron ABC transporter permease [Elusimicrobiota bacterium]|nr:iron ABC transporter permease [Elusimicrobiota bacterium]
MSKKLLRWSIQILILTGVLFAVSIFSLCVGSSGIPLKKIFLTILEGRGSTEYSIIFDIRLPRIILGFAVGGALSLSGVILQGLFRNPLVEPYTLGISGGAALGVCLNIVLGIYHTSILSLPVSGFAGAILVVLIVYFLTLKKGILKIQGLLLTGVMISFISSSLIMFIMAISRVEDLNGIIFWIMGSLEEPSMFLIKITVLLSVFGLFGAYLFCHELNAFALGEEDASHLGVDTEKTKKALFLLSSLLTGCAVSVAGVIGFVGLVIPHFVRMFIGYDHRILIIASFLTGGAFLIVCDTIARTVIAPIELPVGVITGIIGGIMFIYFLNKR